MFAVVMWCGLGEGLLCWCGEEKMKLDVERRREEEIEAKQILRERALF